MDLQADCILTDVEYYKNVSFNPFPVLKLRLDTLLTLAYENKIISKEERHFFQFHIQALHTFIIYPKYIKISQSEWALGMTKYFTY